MPPDGTRLLEEYFLYLQFGNLILLLQQQKTVTQSQQKADTHPEVICNKADLISEGVASGFPAL